MLDSVMRDGVTVTVRAPGARHPECGSHPDNSGLIRPGNDGVGKRGRRWPVSAAVAPGPGGLRWYCVETHASAERLVWHQACGLGFDAVVPQFMDLVPANPKRRTPAREMLRPAFARYLMVEFDVVVHQWQRLASLRGVRRVMGQSAERPSPLSPGRPIAARSVAQNVFGSPNPHRRSCRHRLGCLLVSRRFRRLPGTTASRLSGTGRPRRSHVDQRSHDGPAHLVEKSVAFDDKGDQLPALFDVAFCQATNVAAHLVVPGCGEGLEVLFAQQVGRRFSHPFQIQFRADVPDAVDQQRIRRVMIPHEVTILFAGRIKARVKRTGNAPGAHDPDVRRKVCVQRERDAPGLIAKLSPGNVDVRHHGHRVNPRVRAAGTVQAERSGVEFQKRLFNDLLDIKSDREHPKKRHRPLASGALCV